MRYLHLAVALLLAVSVTACDPTGEDDWGPPAGYATMKGIVSDTSDTPLSGILVFNSTCVFSDLDGIPNDTLGLSPSRTWTDEAGRFELDQSLPPSGAFPMYEGESLEAKCELTAGEDIAEPEARAEGVVMFYRNDDRKQASRIDILITQ